MNVLATFLHLEEQQSTWGEMILDKKLNFNLSKRFSDIEKIFVWGRAKKCNSRWKSDCLMFSLQSNLNNEIGTDNLELEFHLFPKDLSSEWKVPSGELSWWRYFWRSVVFGAGPIHYHNWGPGHVRADYEQNSKTGQIWHQQQLLLEPFHSLWLLLLFGAKKQSEH